MPKLYVIYCTCTTIHHYEVHTNQHHYAGTAASNMQDSYYKHACTGSCPFAIAILNVCVFQTMNTHPLSRVSEVYDQQLQYEWETCRHTASSLRHFLAMQCMHTSKPVYVYSPYSALPNMYE